MAEIGLFDTIYNQRQITRYRRDPVSKEDIDKIIEAATKAPSGGNTQPWHFIAITDPGLIAKVGGLYRDLWLGGRGNTPPPNEPPAYTCGTLLGQSHAGSAGDDPHLRRPLRRLHGPAPRTTAGARALRLVHLAGGAEPVPGSASPRIGYQDHHHPYPGRGENQGVAGASRTTSKRSALLRWDTQEAVSAPPTGNPPRRSRPTTGSATGVRGGSEVRFHLREG